MTRFWTSDLHFGHANIIRYCNRPFGDVDEMNRSLIQRWNDVVGNDDEVWVLGDVAMGRIGDTLGLIRQLHGTKILLAGNHDRCWAPSGVVNTKWNEAYRDAGFAEILQGIIDVTIGNAIGARLSLPVRRRQS